MKNNSKKKNNTANSGDQYSRKNNVVVYLLNKYVHRRVFESLEERPDMDQYLLVPSKIENSTLVPENYDGMKIRKILYYKNKEDIKSILRKLRPYIMVSTRKIEKPFNKVQKRAFVHHGIITENVKKFFNQKGMQWLKNFTFYFFGTKSSIEIITKINPGGYQNILLNVVPQFDLLTTEYYNKYKDTILSKSGAGNKKIILFAGFISENLCDEYGFEQTDYYKISILLDELAKKHNWFIFNKPKLTFENCVALALRYPHLNEYLKKYSDLKDSKNTFFLSVEENIYRFFFSDLVIVNGASTVEIEACALQKPLFVINTNSGSNRNYNFGIDESLAANFISDAKDIETDIVELFKTGAKHYPEKQKEFVASLGLTVDGNMHKRLQDKLAEMIAEIK